VPGLGRAAMVLADAGAVGAPLHRHWDGYSARGYSSALVIPAKIDVYLGASLGAGVIDASLY
jgi:hypothetical protein